MPEEINRIVCDSISDLLLVSEQSGIDNLMKEGVSSSKVHLVGNVMIDTLLRELPKAKQGDTLMRLGLSPRGYGLVTLHRPSNVDDPQVLRALLTVLARISVRLPLLFAMHPRTNKAVHDAGLEHLLDCRGLRTVTPLPYHENLALMDGAAVVLTDSGGMQEETTVLGVPCLTLRETTERPVTITNGTSRLVGKDPERILATLSEVLNTRDRSPRRIPLWDGNAGVRVASTLREWIGTN